jgi:hypothetical protein
VTATTNSTEAVQPTSWSAGAGTTSYRAATAET